MDIKRERERWREYVSKIEGKINRFYIRTEIYYVFISCTAHLLLVSKKDRERNTDRKSEKKCTKREWGNEGVNGREGERKRERENVN